ncbi:RNA polymerase sigma factor [Microtetraspora fusca]|uniref:RNA polymerase sigma factor n=1 Tax=Microtetraspora fusca TaxID=1997 RepID=UPI000A3E6CD4|nr:RNA polymerase sigma factor [Microtetraspora fusca]
MDDRVLVEALRARDPGALAALYDTYAEAIYRYCLVMLGGPDSAQVALRDTLIAAEALVGSLADPERFRVWLYTLARGECLRRRTPQGAEPPDTDLSTVLVPQLSDPADAELRVVAWHATRCLAPEDREVLELASRHGLTGADLATVLGTGQRYADGLQEAATERLSDAVTVEILARKGPYDCPRRAKILTGFSGELTAETRERISRHIARCDTCAAHRVRHVSLAKVFGLLPQATLPDTVRVRVMSCFADPDLVAYRRYVANRVGRLTSAGFPSGGGGRVWPRALGGALATVAAVGLVLMSFNQFAGRPEDRIVGIASDAFPGAGDPPGLKVPWKATPRDRPMILTPILDRDPARTAGARDDEEWPAVQTSPDAGTGAGGTPSPSTSATPSPRPSRVGTPSARPSASPSDDVSPLPEPSDPPSESPTPDDPQTPDREHQRHPRPWRSCPPERSPSPSPSRTPTASPTPSATPSASSTPAPAERPARPARSALPEEPARPVIAGGAAGSPERPGGRHDDGSPNASAAVPTPAESASTG